MPGTFSIYNFEYSETGEVILPTPLVKQGLKGIIECPFYTC